MLGCRDEAEDRVKRDSTVPSPPRWDEKMNSLPANCSTCTVACYCGLLGCREEAEDRVKDKVTAPLPTPVAREAG